MNTNMNIQMRRALFAVFSSAFAVVVGISVPLIESYRATEMTTAEGIGEEGKGVVAGVKIAVVDRLPPLEEGVTIIPTPTPVAVPGSEFSVAARAAAVMDKTTGRLLFRKYENDVRPIASITKLVSAVVIVRRNPSWNEVVTMQPEDEAPNSGGTLAYRGERVRVEDLWHLMLVRSDNHAALALARTTGLSPEEFVRAMNDVAQSWGLRNTRFAEPTGLSEKNVSTPLEVIAILRNALEEEKIREALRVQTYSFAVEGGPRRTFSSTNALLADPEVRIIAGKTGYTDAAGFSFVAAIEGKEGQVVFVSVLGSTSGRQRFEDAKKLAAWSWEHWQWVPQPVRAVGGNIGG